MESKRFLNTLYSTCLLYTSRLHFSQRVQENWNAVNYVYSLIESSFVINAKSGHNHGWTTENPNEVISHNFQNKLLLNVWYGVIGDQLICLLYTSRRV